MSSRSPAGAIRRERPARREGEVRAGDRELIGAQLPAAVLRGEGEARGDHETLERDRLGTHRVQLRALTVQVQGESRVDSGELSGEPGQGELVREARDRTLLEPCGGPEALAGRAARIRSEEHTSELQSLAYLVCRLLLEKK